VTNLNTTDKSKDESRIQRSVFFSQPLAFRLSRLSFFFSCLLDTMPGISSKSRYWYSI